MKDFLKKFLMNCTKLFDAFFFSVLRSLFFPLWVLCVLWRFHKIFIEHNSRYNQCQSDISSNYNRLMQNHRNKEQRKEGWKVAKLIDESRVWSDAHGNAEAYERYGHFETTDIHPCQQTVKVRNAEAEEGDANNQVKTWFLFLA